MSERVYKSIEVTGTSSKGQDEAIENAIEKASKSVHNLRWFEVIESRGSIDGGKVTQWQVTVKLAFALDD